MTTLDLDHVECVQALDIPPGAILVVKCNRRLTVEQAKEAEAQVKAVIPRPVLILSEGWDITVVRDENADH